MANRYWVGGTASWDGTASSKWALTSGGAGGQTVPTLSDDVFFDAASGAVTVTVGAGGAAKSLTFTGFTGTFTGSSNLDIYGNMTLGASMTMSYTGNIQMNGHVTATITCNGKSFGGLISIGSGTFNDIVFVLGDDFINTNDLDLEYGTINANNHNLKCRKFTSNNVNTRTITMGSGIWEITGTGNAWVTDTIIGLTLTPNTSTIKFTDTSTAAVTFLGGGLTFYNIWWARSTSTGISNITSSNTFNNLTDTGTGSHSIRFDDGTNTTLTAATNPLLIAGSPSTQITLRQTVTAGWTLTCASAAVTVSYCTIVNSTATGGAIFRDIGGVNGGSNSGWRFIITSPFPSHYKL